MNIKKAEIHKIDPFTLRVVLFAESGVFEILEFTPGHIKSGKFDSNTQFVLDRVIDKICGIC